MENPFPYTLAGYVSELITMVESKLMLAHIVISAAPMFCTAYSKHFERPDELKLSRAPPQQISVPEVLHF
jgi:hypothetical protein